MSLRTVLIVIWIGLFSYTAYDLYRGQDDSYGPQVATIAKVASKKGVIQFRPKNRYVWRGINTNQRLAVGDNIATGDDATLTILFDNKATLKIDKNTHIRISQIGENAEGSKLEVELLRGALRAANAGEGAEGAVAKDDGDQLLPMTGLNIKAGEDRFQLYSKDSKLALLKTIDGKNPLLQQVRGVVKRENGNGEETLPLLEQILDAKRLKQKPKNFFPLIVSPKPHQVLWVDEPLSELRDLAIRMTVMPTFKKPRSGTWRPMLVGLNRRGEGEATARDWPRLQRGLNLVGTTRFGKQAIDLPFRRLKSQDMVTQGFSPTRIPELRLQVKAAGVIVDDIGQAEYSFSKPTRLAIRSTSIGTESRTVKVLLKDPAISYQRNRPLFSDERLLPSQSMIVQMKDKGQLKNLVPLLFGSQSFKVELGSTPMSPKGIYLFRDKKPVLHLSGAVSANGVKAAASLVSAKLVYQGRIDDYLGQLTDLRGKMSSHTFRSDSKIYVWIDRKEFIGINVNFLKDRAVQRYISNSSLFFKQPVKVLSFDGQWLNNP